MPASNPPDTIEDEAQLDDLLSEPTPAAVRAMKRIEGDLLLLGAGGKMGPTLARMAKRASDAAGVERRVIAVSRFSDEEAERGLIEAGVETIRGDLLAPGFLDTLPDAPNVIHMAAMKFGATGNEPLTWAMNVYVPSLVCSRFCRSRIAAFSTGNVYPLVPIDRGGSVETDPPAPVGEYAMTALGRERLFTYFSAAYKVPVALLRLNYAAELRYGVLVDLARRVRDRKPIDLSMGHVNVIWQGDANAAALAALDDAAVPPLVLNIAGPERLSVRRVCERFGELIDKPVRFTGAEAPTALLSNGAEARRRYGEPRVEADRLIRWTADWVARGGASLGKPTRFEERNGKF